MKTYPVLTKSIAVLFLLGLLQGCVDAYYRATQIGDIIGTATETVKATGELINKGIFSESPSTEKYRLEVNPTPRKSTIKILNIEQKYQPKITLKLGKSRVRVEHPGYKSKTQWVRITDQDVSIKITLKRM
jgi:hypothetical protein